MIGITISSSDSLYVELANEARERFMRHTGLNCLVLTTTHGGNYTTKLQLWKMFKHTKQSFCFFDCDAWAVRDFDLSQYDNREEFFAVIDGEGQRVRPENWPESFTHKDAIRHGVPFERMFNGGFWIANAHYHSQIFETALQYLRAPHVYFYDFGEQSSVSKALFDLDAPVEALPVEFNACFGGSTPLSEVCENPFMIHAAGVESRDKLALLKSASRKFKS